MSFESTHEGYQKRCEDVLKDVVRRYFVPGSQVGAAAEYALLNGGKRVRGVLVQAVADMLGGGADTAASFAAAIEMIHAFSLVHDDFPCMDDDDMRRGKPATHIAYGEATALLAGDLLATEAFEVIANAPAEGAARSRACAILAKASGAMIYGQELDLKYEDETADESTLRLIHTNKTGALIRAAADLGITAAGRSPQEEPKVGIYADSIGLVFQIVDDILDTTSTDEELGKPVGSDAEQGKTTFVTMFGPERARWEVRALTDVATEALNGTYGEKAAFLCKYATLLAERVK